MKYEVRFIRDAERDLFEIYRDFALSDAPEYLKLCCENWKKHI